MAKGLQAIIKSVSDRTIAAALLLLASPVLAVSAGLTWLTDGAPVFFRQDRAGKGGQPFTVSKIRTMRVHSLPASAVGQVTGDHPLVTPLGRFLRRSRIDELPQLTSVLRGDMSLVGPRPVLPEVAEQYDEWERRRLAVLPGLTGWAQVNGNVRLSWPERIVLDVWYVDHWSTWLDVRVMAKTFMTVALGERRNEAALKEAQNYAERVGRSGGEHTGHAQDDVER